MRVQKMFSKLISKKDILKWNFLMNLNQKQTLFHQTETLMLTLLLLIMEMFNFIKKKNMLKSSVINLQQDCLQLQILCLLLITTSTSPSKQKKTTLCQCGSQNLIFLPSKPSPKSLLNKQKDLNTILCLSEIRNRLRNVNMLNM